MPLNPEFIINLHGKQFVLFAGLLDLAHQGGLRGIETEILADYSRPNEDFWVVRAVGSFRTEDGTDGVFSAVGDAGPANSQMRGAYLRHAETRAMARMLRLATNVGMCSVEELGPEVKENGNGAGQHPVPVREGVAGPVASGVRGGAPAGGPARATGGETQPAPGTSPIPPQCSIQGCGKFLTTKQRQESLDQFGEIYCQAHQPHESVS